MAGLFCAAMVSLWQAGSAGLRRERLRAEAPRILRDVCTDLARAGAEALSLVPDWPLTLDPGQWEVLDDWLEEESRPALTSSTGVIGGYYVAQEDRYLGAVDLGEREPAAVMGGGLALDFDLIESQVRQALQRNRPVTLTVERAGGVAAVRAEPVRVNGRRVAAIWAAVRLEDPVGRERHFSLYRRATGLALGAVGLAGVLALGLAATVRAQARERLRMQDELRRKQRLAALGTMLAGVAHEVRNPLAGIRSTVQLWQRGHPTDAGSMEDLAGEVDRLDGLVSQLLQFSRAEHRPRVPLGLDEPLEDAVRLSQRNAEEAGVAIARTPDATGSRVRMDPEAIVQLVRSLIQNAVQAMPEGGTVRVETRRGDTPGRVEIRITDTGPGLSAEAREHLFEPFYTTKRDGTGLGLAIAREIAIGHGGDLRVEHPPEGGARFVVELPVG